MKKKVLLITCTLSAMLLSGCGLLGGVSREDMEAAIADRDYYMEEYNEAVEEQAELEAEIDDLEAQVAELEEENADLLDVIATMEEEVEEEPAISGPTLEDYYTQPGIQEAVDEQIDEARVQYADTYSDVGWYVYENTFTYWYEFKNPVADPEAMENQIRTNLSNSNLSDLVEMMEQQTGVTGITIEYIYYNSDGSLICSVEYSS